MLSKRILASLLALCIIFSGMTISVSASTPWDGSTIDVTWNTGDAVMSISTAEGLAGLASLVNAGTYDFAGKTIELTDDIDLNGENWTPIGKVTAEVGSGTAAASIAGAAFAGTFDGAGYQIIGLSTKTVTGNRAYGLFGYVKGATIKNVNIDATSVIDVSGPLNASDYGTVVGLSVTSFISNCSSAASITDDGTSGTANTANIGGIAGRIDFGSTLEYSFNTGNINLASVKARVGGLAGCAPFNNGSNTDVIKYCYNTGDVTVNVNDGAGGLVGFSRNTGWVDFCYNTGDIRSNQNTSANDSVAGLIAIVRVSGKLKNSYNIGTVTCAKTANGQVKGVIGSGGTALINTTYSLTGAAQSAEGNYERSAADIKTVFPALTPSADDVCFEADAYDLNNGYPVLSWQNDPYFYTPAEIIAMIAALPAVGAITLDDEGAIEDVRIAYETLSDDDKAAVTNYATLETAEAKIEDLKDAAAVAPVIAMITALPATNSLALQDKPDVLAALDAYNALSDDLKAFVTNFAVLEAAVAKIAELAVDVPVDVWDGISVDTDWNTGADRMVISTAAELAGLASLVNSGNDFAGKSIYLLNGIDLAGYDWTPIGDVTTSLTTGALPANIGNYFAGTFEGYENEIIGLSVKTNATNKAYGLFAFNKGTIKNLSIDATSVIDVTNAVADSDYGSIVGMNMGGTISNCSTAATIMDDGTTAFPSNASANIGGIAGRNDFEGCIEYCFNTGNIALVSIRGRVGGIAGVTRFTTTSTSATIKYCYNMADISVGPNDAVGGIVAFARGGTINFCYNSGNISSTNANGNSATAGLVGLLRANDILTNSYNVGEISTTQESNPNCKGVFGAGNAPAANANLRSLEGKATIADSNFECDADTIKSLYPSISETADGVSFVEDVNNWNGAFPVFNWQKAPEIVEGLPNELTLSISISHASGGSTVAGRTDMVWSATVMVNNSIEQDAYDIFNDSSVAIKEYGVYYGTSETAVSQWRNLSTDPVLQNTLKNVIFDEGDDIHVYTTYGFRLRNCPNGATRAAMFYIVYEYENTEYAALSIIDELVV